MSDKLKRLPNPGGFVDIYSHTYLVSVTGHRPEKVYSGWTKARMRAYYMAKFPGLSVIVRDCNA